MKYILLLIAFAICSNSFAQYTSVDAFPNITIFKPVELTQAPDGSDRFFVASQTGQIRVLKNNPNAQQADFKMFLDIPDSVTQTGFQGLFSMTFHPNYTTNRYFYVYYSAGPIPNMVNKIVRFTASATNPDSALPSSKLEILTIPYGYSEHNGGGMAFGNDGYLYVSLGDGSPSSGGDTANRSQNRADLHGKIIRLNVDAASGGLNYSIPTTNPFYNNPSGYRQEIYAYGFRNVWKFNFDPPTGRLWAGDVGQLRMEEIDIVNSGLNYGWRYKEGTLCYNPSSGCDTIPGLTDPVFEYPHSTGLSVTGGYVYRGRSLTNLIGKYIYGDYITGKVWALTYDGVNPTTTQLLFDTPHYITDFALDTAKNIYYANYGFVEQPKIYKIIDTSSVGVTQISSTIPDNFILNQNYPNPFNPATNLSFEIITSSFVTLEVFDVNGRKLETLVNQKLSPGTYNSNWNAQNYSSGVYFYTLRTESFSDTKRMVLLK